MMGRTHKLFAFLLILLALKLGVGFGSDIGIAFIGAFIIGSTILSPDIDLKFEWIPGVNHRGITHSFIGALVACCIVAMIPLAFGYPTGIMNLAAGVGFGCAWLAHRIGDEMSNQVGGIKHDFILYVLILIAIALIANDIFHIAKL